MTEEFEGKTEQEAIDIASQALGLPPEDFEVEIVEENRGGLFHRNKSVRIRVHIAERDLFAQSSGTAPTTRNSSHADGSGGGNRAFAEETEAGDPETDFEHAIADFVASVTDKMGYPAEVRVAHRSDGKLVLRLMSDHSNILIGRKGKNLDALQVLANVVAGRFEDNAPKIVVDTEGYRGRREESLIRMAERVGDQVRRTHKGKLLEPMNPFERRLIHTTLSKMEDVATESEGEGLYKQVRVFYRGSGRS